MIKEERKKYYSFDLIGQDLSTQHGSVVIEVDEHASPKKALEIAHADQGCGCYRIINFRRIE